MKYIKTYEGLFRSKKYELDDIVKDLFQRAKGIFEFDCLKVYGANNFDISDGIDDDVNEGYIYKLDETDSKYGYIKIKILEVIRDSESFFVFASRNQRQDTYYVLYIDEKEIECSESIKKEMLKFFRGKIKEGKNK